MIKYYLDSQVFREVPDEISMGLSITNCQFKCKGCHSAMLREDIGTELTDDEFRRLMKKNEGVTCVCILGEGNDLDRLIEIFQLIRDEYDDVKTCLYTSNTVKSLKVPLRFLDYLKVGPFVLARGPLDNPNTNQRFYTVIDGVITEDITSKFLQ